MKYLDVYEPPPEQDTEEVEFEGEGNEPDNDDPIQSIEWI